MKIDVLRCLDGQLKQVEVWSKDLVPGDVLVIPPGGVQLPCDAALISGRNFSTNRSQKTGCFDNIYSAVIISSVSKAVLPCLHC